MATYEVTTEDGKTYEVETEDQNAKGPIDKTISKVKDAAVDFATDVAGPKNLYKKYGDSLPSRGAIIGGSVAGVPGAAIGGGAGQIAKNLMGLSVGDPNEPKTAMGAAVPAMQEAATAGLFQEPKILNQIPGVEQASEFVGKGVSKIGPGLAKLAQSVTGAKANILEQGAKQGLSTYGAVSMEKAQQIFGKALQAEGVAAKRPLEQIIDPQLANARDVALNAGKKFEEFMHGSGIPPTAEELLRGRQAVDRIYNATSPLDRSTRGDLADLRTGFDNMLSTVSGKLGDASRTYRKAIVKDTLLTPFKITKQGQYSAVAPMIATLAASAGIGSGHKKESGLAGLGYLAASSPLVAGLGATAGGSAVRGLMQLGQDPAIRQALLGVLQKMMAKKKEK